MAAPSPEERSSALAVVAPALEALGEVERWIGAVETAPTVPAALLCALRGQGWSGSLIERLRALSPVLEPIAGYQTVALQADGYASQFADAVLVEFRGRVPPVPTMALLRSHANTRLAQLAFLRVALESVATTERSR